MAIDTFTVNHRPNTFGGTLSALVEMLVGAGWTYKASGDGLSGYNATGKVFTGTGSGALGWSNNRAWARVADPAGRREICLQHSNAGLARIKISTNAKFVGGSPSATVVPSATDERVLFGSGTDATPTMVGWLFAETTTTDNVVCQGCALASPPYGFWFAQQQIQQLQHAGWLMMDPVLGSPDDPDPVVWSAGTQQACLVSSTGLGRDGNLTGTWTAAVGTANACFAHLDLAMSSSGFVYVQPATYGFGTSGSHVLAAAGPGNNFVGVNPFDRSLDALPVMYARARIAGTIQPWGFKGWSSLSMWTGALRQSFFDTLDDRRWICLGHLWLRWNGLSDPFG